MQANFEGSSWSGNIGLRYVQTEEARRDFYDQPRRRSGRDNGLALRPVQRDPRRQHLRRLAAEREPEVAGHRRRDRALRGGHDDDARRLFRARRRHEPAAARPRVDGTGTGTGGNPDLEPIRSTNYDAGLEWYFAEKSLLAATIFYMDLDNYVELRQRHQEVPDLQRRVPGRRDGSVPPDRAGQCLGPGAGLRARVPAGDHRELRLRRELHVRGRRADVAGDHRRRPPGRDLGGHVQPERLLREPSASTRASTTRSARSSSAASIATRRSHRTTSTRWRRRSGTSSTTTSRSRLDGQNLNDPTLKYFALNEDQPRAFYKNGAQYYLNLRIKF